MHRLTGQPSFVDAFIAAEGLGRNPDLEAIAAAIDWDRVTALVASIHAAPEGRPGYPPGVMVKALLLQQWHSRRRSFKQTKDGTRKGVRPSQANPPEAQLLPQAVTQRSPQAGTQSRCRMH